MKTRDPEAIIIAAIKAAMASVATSTAKVREIRKARAKVEGGAAR